MLLLLLLLCSRSCTPERDADSCCGQTTLPKFHVHWKNPQDKRSSKKNQVKGWWIYQQWHVVHVTFDSATVRSLVTIFRTVPLQMRSWSIRRCQTSSSGHPFFFHGWWKSGLRGRTDITLITQLGVGSSNAPSDDGRPGVFSGGRGTTHYWGANRTRLIGSPVSARIPRANINDEGELRSLSLS